MSVLDYEMKPFLAFPQANGDTVTKHSLDAAPV